MSLRPVLQLAIPFRALGITGLQQELRVGVRFASECDHWRTGSGDESQGDIASSTESASASRAPLTSRKRSGSNAPQLAAFGPINFPVSEAMFHTAMASCSKISASANTLPSVSASLSSAT